MATFRIRTEFDLEIRDEDTARAIARQHWVDRIDDATLSGHNISQSVTGTPADGIDAVLESPRAVATSVVVELLRRGAGSLPMAHCTNLTIAHVDQ